MVTVTFKRKDKFVFEVYQKSIANLDEAKAIKRLIELKGHWIENGAFQGPPVLVKIEQQQQ